MEQGDIVGALALSEELLHIRRDAGQLQTEHSADLLWGIGMMKVKQGDSPGAFEAE